ncbi:MAG TPA: hypothetical protein VIG07_11230 [Methylomirabilota bacterium]
MGAVLLAGWGVALAADPGSSTADGLATSLGTLALAAGALGTAAFGIVDGLKLIPWIDLAGFERLFSRGSTAQGGRRWPTTIRANLDPLVPPLTLAYGNDVMELLKAQYRSGRGKGDLPRTLRQGVRIGLGLMPDAGVAAIAKGLGLPTETADRVGRALVATRSMRPPALGQPETAVQPPPIPDDDRAALARLETAIDARIDAALVLADNLYVIQTKLVASVVAVGIGLGVGKILGAPWLGLAVGFAAVPLAPVAHDAATALQEAVKAVQAVKRR